VELKNEARITLFLIWKGVLKRVISSQVFVSFDKKSSSAVRTIEGKKDVALLIYIEDWRRIRLRRFFFGVGGLSQRSCYD